jgi:NAD(P)-dependent dehydrogenase (short-subunit alcohol dehydrogenase family)
MANPETPHKLILITGATKGLGRALAEGFAGGGHTVIGCGRSAAEIDQLRRKPGAPHVFDVIDVTREDQVKDWAQRTLAAQGAPDLLVNNAAAINANAPLWEVPADEFNHVVDVNLKGVANVLRHLVPAMITRGRGVIVNLSSGWGRATAPMVAPYCASKWGIEGLTRALAQELPPGLAAVPLNPGIVNTDMLQSCFGDKAAKYVGPEEWAKTAVPFLLELGPKDNGQPLSTPGR